MHGSVIRRPLLRPRGIRIWLEVEQRGGKNSWSVMTLLSCWVSHLRNLPQTLISQVRENNFLRIQFSLLWKQDSCSSQDPFVWQNRYNLLYYPGSNLRNTGKVTLGKTWFWWRHVTPINSAWGRVAKWLGKGGSVLPSLVTLFKIISLFINFQLFWVFIASWSLL